MRMYSGLVCDMGLMGLSSMVFPSLFPYSVIALPKCLNPSVTARIVIIEENRCMYTMEKIKNSKIL